MMLKVMKYSGQSTLAPLMIEARQSFPMFAQKIYPKSAAWHAAGGPIRGVCPNCRLTLHSAAPILPS